MIQLADTCGRYAVECRSGSGRSLEQVVDDLTINLKSDLLSNGRDNLSLGVKTVEGAKVFGSLGRP